MAFVAAEAWMVLKLEGVQAVKKVTASGHIRIYYRHRRSGMNLGSSANETEVLARYKAITTLRKSGAIRERAPGSISEGVQKYMTSLEWSALAPSTKDLWRRNLGRLEELWGAFPFAALTRDVAAAAKRSFVRAHGPIGGKHMIVTARAFWNWLLQQGLTNVQNPFTRLGKFETRDQRRLRRDKKRSAIWRVEEVQAFLNAKRLVNVGGNPKLIDGKSQLKERATPDDMRLALLLGLFSLQRQSDVLDMRGDMIVVRGGEWWLRLDQNKTDEFIGFPIHPVLREELVRQEIKPGDKRLLVQSPIAKGRYSRRRFMRRWAVWVKAANLKLSFQALRRSGMVWLSELGATVQEIAAISGHSISGTSAILEEYIPRTEAMAASAIRIWKSDTRLQI